MKKIPRYLIAIAFIFTLNFFIPRAMPGDPVTNILGEDAAVTQEDITALKSRLGLDRPMILQYAGYWRDIFRGDLGYSYHLHTQVSKILFSRSVWTLALVGISIILGAVMGSLLGAVSGWKTGRMRSRILTVFFQMIYSTPPFFLSLLCLYIFAFKLGWAPMRGFYQTGTPGDIFAHFLLPVLVLSLFLTARNFLIMRGSVIQEKDKPYVLFSRAKGLPGGKILFHHIFKNASLPLITLIALDFGFIFSGALFIEIVFSLNGMGTLIFEALKARDYPVIQGAFLLITLMVVVVNLAADILYSVLDPRIREGGT